MYAWTAVSAVGLVTITLADDLLSVIIVAVALVAVIVFTTRPLRPAMAEADEPELLDAVPSEAVGRDDDG